VIHSLLEKLFGCAHDRTTFPITPSRVSGLSGGARKGTYIVCLDCGKEFDYNWNEMRIGNSVETPLTSPAVSRAEQIAAH
jgi:hypothetical protein